MTKRFFETLVLCFCLLLPGAEMILSQDTPAVSNHKIRIAVLCINTTTGKNHWSGIDEAFKASPFSKYIDHKPYYYSKSIDGFEQLKRIIDNKEADIILGPTESDIYVRAVDIEEELSEKKIPVISGLVTAKVGNQSDGWFFRTNVDVNRRVQIVFDFLNKYWIGKVAVIYADTEFGRRAERTLKGELKILGQEERLLSLLYDDPPNPRKQLASIFKNRPEAVGLFCEREDIEIIYEQFKTMNSSITPYNPIFFTILDIRRLADKVDDFYFVSLAGEDKEDKKRRENKNPKDVEVKALGFDLALLVLKVLDDMNHKNDVFHQPFDENKRDEFRKQLVIHMMHHLHLSGSKTGMMFNDLENVTKPGIFHLENGIAKSKPIPEYVGLLEKILYRIKLIFSVYGVLVIAFIILAILVIALSISRMEIKRVFPNKHIKIFKTKALYLYIITHIFVVMLLYVFLCESGRIRYDDLLMAVIISLTPTALMKTTFFETKYGRTLGLEEFYKSWMEGIELKIMEERYDRLQALINVIAYRNSLDSIRNSLRQIFRQHPSPAQRAKLIQKMEEEIEREPEYLNKRRVGARFLIRRFDRAQLKAEGFVPHDWDYDKSHDPKIIVRIVSKYCSKDPDKIKKIEDILNNELEELKKRNPDRHAEMVDFMAKEKKETVAVEGILNVIVRNLFVLKGFDTEWLIKEGFLPQEEWERLNRGQENQKNG
ncbi:MAG: ABC transporter substrate-binding protein [Candidatus Aminicenantes bacterium]|nr:ABC transporter substrate-binding protein [Candidatus Aminicenantes bacterium]NIM82794.1 ABC transporter substrate-binding protein [Candidatus Aminicenantes bacterium]NIN22169.1 ABC transporter substrate-binding protein [Candidatus Aminicenantes bacterium]NIN41166.1 ABC transporter substrate-binding protein [Candidatus Aminicenantes bacterium]NIN88765.1 ABC transporter substrate-binding protein [Candidatus Aminicenantes bacterium]